MRLKFLDQLRGIAFILMFIQHIFYIKDLSNNFVTNYSNNFIITIIGKISRNLFLLLVGISIYKSYCNNKYSTFIKKRFKRSLIIFLHALIISIITHYFYPMYGIKFGVLHFISIASILSIPFVNNPIFGLLLFFLMKDNITLINPLIDLILGTNPQYNMMDYFPILTWFPVILIGIFIGTIYTEPSINLVNSFILEYIGKNSLLFYTIHFILLIIFFKKNI